MTHAGPPALPGPSGPGFILTFFILVKVKKRFFLESTGFLAQDK
jgi:hypothetical protein